MDSADELGFCSSDFARRFLQTAVVVDDKPYMPSDGSDGPKREVVTPGRHGPSLSQDDQGLIGRRSVHALNAGSIVESFSALGIICGVVGPKTSAMPTMRKADIVVLDWFLRDNMPEYTLQLLLGLLTSDADRNSLRLVSIYTGEARLQDICKAVVAKLEKAGLRPEENEVKTEISYRHGRIVLYAKSDVKLVAALKHRSASEEDLPEKLVRDFASMTSGLLPSIALASLTAVREGEHKVLDRFHADLDPAFLTQRACLDSPEDVEGQIVNHVAEELRGLMDSVVSEASSEFSDAVKNWIRHRGSETQGFTFSGRKIDLEQTIELANKGLAASVLKKSAFVGLSAGFSNHDAVELDEKLAWIISFRTVYNKPSPILWLGSVVTDLSDGDERHLICMRPRCDCIRLNRNTSFFFLPLVEPQKEEEQIVVKLDHTFKRLGVNFDSAGWVHRQFHPGEGNKSKISAAKKPDGSFEFVDTCNRRYRWRGELKAEFAQRIAHNFAAPLARVAVDESEWLRRMIRRMKGRG